VDISTFVTLLVYFFVSFWPVVMVVAVLIGGPLLGCIVFAVVGAIRNGRGQPEETRDVDLDEFFSSQTPVGASAVASGRNDSI
jgi:hypothetical protein